MEINLTVFLLFNVIDTCAVWNILSSMKLYNASLNAGCKYSFTKFIEYECIRKERSVWTQDAMHLRELLIKEMGKNKIQAYSISIQDLQEIEVLRQRKNLGRGELSAIVFAKKTNQAFLTDDQPARKLAEKILGKGKVQTTPHLLGHLFYKRHLIDADITEVISEHNSYTSNSWGKLDAFFKSVYEESLRIRLMESQS
jgi:predicted nucleic acid-binding protein